MALKMGMDVHYGVFKFLVVGLDVRRMNEVCNFIAIYIFLYYNNIEFGKCDDISVILEFFCDSLSVIKQINCIDFICSVEDIIVVNMDWQRMIEKNFCKYEHLDSEMSEV